MRTRNRQAATILGLFLTALTLAPVGFSPASQGATHESARSGRSALVVAPLHSKLVGGRAVAQLLATIDEGTATCRDATREVEWISMDPAIAIISASGRVTPRGNGTARIVARLGSYEAAASVDVVALDQPSPVSFRRDVIPAFSQAGCNMGACHGTPTGKGGFRLSLRGYLPDQDFATLSREIAGRRINTLSAETSLLLRKPLGQVPHEGGLRLAKGSKSYEFLRDWIALGAHDDPESTLPTRIEILPGARVLNDAAQTQQIVVLAHDDKGYVRDVTAICYFDSSNPSIAEVDADGYVRFKARGEVAVVAHYLNLVANVRLTHLTAVPGFIAAKVPHDNLIDHAVFAKLNRMRIPPSSTCDDSEFLRRATLDLVGMLPTTDETRAYLAEPEGSRRALLINRLLDRPEFNEFWALKLADVLRANGRLIQPKGAYVFHRWIRACLEKNMPMDQFVRELLTADGSTYRNPAANYYRVSRDPETAMESTAQLFLGVRIQCAKCHNHPFERWTQDDYYGFAAFFAQVGRKKGNLLEEEVIYPRTTGDVRQPRTGRVMPPKALGGPVLDQPGSPDRRVRLATWLAGPQNPFFAKSLVNRVWFHVMGRGIVEPIDDFRDSNPASNDELLDGLATDFVKNGYDLKRLVRLIASSRVYALSAHPNALNKDDSLYFSHAIAKLFPAEVLLDSISSFTGSQTAFENLPKGARATQIPDGKIENAFLKTFGRPARELACECERESDSNLSQALQLIGGATVNGKLRDDNGRMARLASSKATPDEIAHELYTAAFSREPTADERAAVRKHLATAPDRRQAVEDLGWALINSKEFLFRH